MGQKGRRAVSARVISQDLKGIICKANWLNIIDNSLREGFFFTYKRDSEIQVGGSLNGMYVSLKQTAVESFLCYQCLRLIHLSQQMVSLLVALT